MTAIMVFLISVFCADGSAFNFKKGGNQKRSGRFTTNRPDSVMDFFGTSLCLIPIIGRLYRKFSI